MENNIKTGNSAKITLPTSLSTFVGNFQTSKQRRTMKKINHVSYTHYAIPPYYILPKKCDGMLTGKFKFTSESKYAISPENQGDMNKMIGIKSGLLSQTTDGAMIGWNYDNKRDAFSVCLYVHGGSGKGFKVGSGNAFMSIPVDVKVDLDYRFSLVLTPEKAALTLYPIGVPDIVKLNLNRDKSHLNGWVINPFFGGQECAKCSYLLELE
jgi:hypothetical protein